MLQARGLGVAYGPVKVLHGLDLDIGSGEIVALIGPKRSSAPFQRAPLE